MLSSILSRTFSRLNLQASQQINLKFNEKLFKTEKKCFCSEPLLLYRSYTLIEEGNDFQEVPIIVRKINEIGNFLDQKIIQETGDKIEDTKKLTENNAEQTIIIAKGLPLSLNMENIDKNENRIDISTEEGTAILYTSDLEFLKNTEIEQILKNLDPNSNSCSNYSYIENAITNEINSRVALQTLSRIIEMENFKFHQDFAFNEKSVVQEKNRETVLKKLVDIITKSRDSESIIVGMGILINDRVSPLRNIYRDRLRNETLIRLIDGDFSITQLIDIVGILNLCRDPFYKETIDLLWIGVKIRENEINKENIVSLFKIQHYFHESRNLFLTILTSRLKIIYPELPAQQIADILNICHLNNFKNNEKSFNIVKNLTSQWIQNYSMQTEEKELKNIIENLTNINYVDETIIHGLEKYLEINESKIEDPEFISALMKYCKKCRFSSLKILEFGAEYLRSQGMNLPIKFIAPIFTVFGYFPNKIEKNDFIFDEMRKILQGKFTKLDLNSCCDIILSYIYAGKKFDNFLNEKKFQGKLKRILKIKKKSESHNLLMKKIQTINSIITIESRKNFNKGKFFFPSNYEKFTTPSFHDLRLRQVVKKISPLLINFIGNNNRCGYELIFADLPLIDIFHVDILIFPEKINLPIIEISAVNRIKSCKIILIHLPEHYCFDGKELIGEQLLRIRVLRKMGFQVASLNYEFLSRMNSVELKNYLSKQINSAK